MSSPDGPRPNSRRLSNTTILWATQNRRVDQRHAQRRDLLGMTYADLRPVLGTIDVPTLMLYGERSKIFPTDVGARLEDAIPEATRVPFAESGHCPFWEGPKKFNAELNSFVG